MPRFWSKFARYAFALGSQGGGMLLNIATQIFLARYMGPANYGRIALITSMVLLLANLGTWGVTQMLPRYFSVYRGARKYGSIRILLRSSGYFFAVVSVVVTLVVLSASSVVASLLGVSGLETSLMAFGVFMPVLCLYLWATSVLKGMGHNAKENFLTTVLLSGLTLLASTIAWFSTHSVNWTLAAQGLSYLIVSLVTLYFVARAVSALPEGTDAPEESFWHILRNGLPLAVTTASSQIFRRGDSVVIVAMLGEAALGYYRVAYTIASGIRNALAPINDFSTARMSVSIGKGDTDGVWRGYEFAIRISLAIALPAFLICAAFSYELMHLAFGQKYIAAAPLLPILCAGFIFHVAMGPMGSLFITLGRNWLRMFMVIFVAVFNIAANIFFIKLWGLHGTAYGTAASFLVLYALLTLSLIWREGQSGMTKASTLYTLASIAVGAGLIAIPGVALKAAVTLLAAGVFFCVGVFLALKALYPQASVATIIPDVKRLLNDTLEARKARRNMKRNPVESERDASVV